MLAILATRAVKPAQAYWIRIVKVVTLRSYFIRTKGPASMPVSLVNISLIIYAKSATLNARLVLGDLKTTVSPVQQIISCFPQQGNACRSVQNIISLIKIRNAWNVGFIAISVRAILTATNAWMDSYCLIMNALINAQIKHILVKKLMFLISFTSH